ncbi:MAG TPA: FHA domain-containing protein [Solirubrobacteraceae bacterium]|nr:FHA domain-containing protein [Solirubrobacteraceae bacterium]
MSSSSVHLASVQLAPVSVGLKFGFLAILYLFLMWVAWSALRDMRRGRGGVVSVDREQPSSDATGIYTADSGLGAGGVDDEFEPRLLVERATGHPTGVAYDLTDGAALGRGDVEIRLEDPFASARHARITKQGRTLVIEDLGSTNGTYLNEEPLNGPQPLHPGDRIRIGDSEFTYLQ